MKKILFIIICASLWITSCAPKIYQDVNAVSIAQTHKTIAILPPLVAISAKKNVDAESLKEQQRTEAINFQKEMYSWLLKRKSQGKLKVEIQDVEVTNAMLRKIDVDKLLTMTPVEMGQLLKADAVVKSNF